MLRQQLFVLFLWLSVIGLSTWIGGTLFHMIVVLPLWSQPLPGSVHEFFGGTRAYELLLDFYGPQWMVIRVLPILIALWLGWNHVRHRVSLLITSLTIALAIVLSVLIVFPINEIIMANAGAGSSSEAIEQMVHTWIVADRSRFALVFVGFLFLLRAFRLPTSTSKDPVFASGWSGPPV